MMYLFFGCKSSGVERPGRANLGAGSCTFPGNTYSLLSNRMMGAPKPAEPALLTGVRMNNFRRTGVHAVVATDAEPGKAILRHGAGRTQQRVTLAESCRSDVGAPRRPSSAPPAPAKKTRRATSELLRGRTHLEFGPERLPAWQRAYPAIR